MLLPGSKREVRNVGSENRGWFDEFKVCSQRDAYGITVNSWDDVAITNWCCFWQRTGAEAKTNTDTE